MVTILHLSDLHFGRPYLPHVGEAVLRIVPTLRADIQVISGDFSQRAKNEEFADARAFLDKLPTGPPQIVVPGNHDVPLYRVMERLTDPYANYREHISKELEGVYRSDDAVIVYLNSTAPRRTITNGRITEKQIDFCAEKFADAPESAVKIVVAHHHFAPAPDYEGDKTIIGGRRALDRFVDIGVEMIMGGHLHRAYIGNSLDIYPGENRERGVVILQSGTSTSRRGRAREREKNSFNLLKVTETMFHVTHYMFFEDTSEFAPMSRHIFPRPGRRFIDD